MILDMAYNFELFGGIVGVIAMWSTLIVGLCEYGEFIVVSVGMISSLVSDYVVGFGCVVLILTFVGFDVT